MMLARRNLGDVNNYGFVPDTPGTPGLPVGYDPGTGLVDPYNTTGETGATCTNAGGAVVACTSSAALSCTPLATCDPNVAWLNASNTTPTPGGVPKPAPGGNPLSGISQSTLLIVAAVVLIMAATK